MSRCDHAKLSALLDGELSEAEAGKLRRHVDDCDGCRHELEGLSQLVRGLSSLPNVEGGDNWSVLVNRLAAEPPRPLFAEALPWWRRRFVMPALAVAVAALTGGGVLRWHKGRGLSDDAVIAQAEAEFRAADAHYRLAVEQLRTVAEKQREAWTPPKRAEYDAAQSQLEAAVARCHGVAGERPADPDAEELLFAAYRKEIRFYEDQMMRQAMWETRR